MGRLRSLLIPGVDKRLLVRDATKLMPDLARRRFIAGGASLGGLTLLTGCDVSDSFSAEEMLKQISKFNDGVQAAIFNPDALAPTFPESAITRPFPFNGYYGEDEVRVIDGSTFKLELAGMIKEKKPWTLPELYAPLLDRLVALLLRIDSGLELGSTIQDLRPASRCSFAHTHRRQRAVQVVACRRVVDSLLREIGRIVAAFALGSGSRVDAILHSELRPVVHSGRLDARVRLELRVRIRCRVLLLIVGFDACIADASQIVRQILRVGRHPVDVVLRAAFRDDAACLHRLEHGNCLRRLDSGLRQRSGRLRDDALVL